MQNHSTRLIGTQLTGPQSSDYNLSWIEEAKLPPSSFEVFLAAVNYIIPSSMKTTQDILLTVIIDQLEIAKDAFKKKDWSKAKSNFEKCLAGLQGLSEEQKNELDPSRFLKEHINYNLAQCYYHLYDWKRCKTILAASRHPYALIDLVIIKFNELPRPTEAQLNELISLLEPARNSRQLIDKIDEKVTTQNRHLYLTILSSYKIDIIKATEEAYYVTIILQNYIYKMHEIQTDKNQSMMMDMRLSQLLFDPIFFRDRRKTDHSVSSGNSLRDCFLSQHIMCSQETYQLCASGLTSLINDNLNLKNPRRTQLSFAAMPSWFMSEEKLKSEFQRANAIVLHIKYNTQKNKPQRSLNPRVESKQISQENEQRKKTEALHGEIVGLLNASIQAGNVRSALMLFEIYITEKDFPRAFAALQSVMQFKNKFIDSDKKCVMQVLQMITNGILDDKITYTQAVEIFSEDLISYIDANLRKFDVFHFDDFGHYFYLLSKLGTYFTAGDKIPETFSLIYKHKIKSETTLTTYHFQNLYISTLAYWYAKFFGDRIIAIEIAYNMMDMMRSDLGSVYKLEEAVIHVKDAPYNLLANHPAIVKLYDKIGKYLLSINEHDLASNLTKKFTTIRDNAKANTFHLKSIDQPEEEHKKQEFLKLTSQLDSTRTCLPADQIKKIGRKGTPPLSPDDLTIYSYLEVFDKYSIEIKRRKPLCFIFLKRDLPVIEQYLNKICCDYPLYSVEQLSGAVLNIGRLGLERSKNPLINDALMGCLEMLMFRLLVEGDINHISSALYALAITDIEVEQLKHFLFVLTYKLKLLINSPNVNIKKYNVTYIIYSLCLLMDDLYRNTESYFLDDYLQPFFIEFMTHLNKIYKPHDNSFSSNQLNSLQLSLETMKTLYPEVGADVVAQLSEFIDKFDTGSVPEEKTAEQSLEINIPPLAPLEPVVKNVTAQNINPTAINNKTDKILDFLNALVHDGVIKEVKLEHPVGVRNVDYMVTTTQGNSFIIEKDGPQHRYVSFDNELNQRNRSTRLRNLVLSKSYPLLCIDVVELANDEEWQLKITEVINQVDKAASVEHTRVFRRF